MLAGIPTTNAIFGDCSGPHDYADVRWYRWVELLPVVAVRDGVDVGVGCRSSDYNAHCGSELAQTFYRRSRGGGHLDFDVTLRQLT